MDKFQAVITGASAGASGLLLCLGFGLVADMSARQAAADASWRVERSAQVARSDARERARNESASREIAALRFRTRPAVAPTVVVDTTADDEASELAEPVYATPVSSDFGSVREAVLTGDRAKIREAIERHNATGAEPVFLHDDPELSKRGVAVRARYDHRGGDFAVVLEAQGSNEEPCTVVVAPGSIVRSGAEGDQDTAPIQARFLHVKPQGKAEERAVIACAQIHSNDPRGHHPRGLTTHADPRVGLVAAAAERAHASWGAAQVAIWAVANNVTRDEVASAPGNYMSYVGGARDVLEGAGIDTNALPLYSKSSPRARRAVLELDPFERLVRGG